MQTFCMYNKFYYIVWSCYSKFNFKKNVFVPEGQFVQQAQ